MTEQLRAALESMVWQFANHRVIDDKPALGTGGLSALEEAFDALGWDDPHYVDPDDVCCEIEGCMEWARNGMIWGGLYLHLCNYHTGQIRYAARPAVKAHALAREATRGPDGRLPM